jgi:hypothetical protein
MKKSLTINLVPLFRLLAAGFLGWALITGHLVIMQENLVQKGSIFITPAWRVAWVSR